MLQVAARRPPRALEAEEVAATRGLCSATTTPASTNLPQRACLALHLALLGASAAQIKETPRLAARYPERYFREQCVHLGKVTAAIAGVWRLTGSRRLQGTRRKIQSEQSFASAMHIHVTPLPKRVFRQLFCSVINGKGSLKARQESSRAPHRTWPLPELAEHLMLGSSCLRQYRAVHRIAESQAIHLPHG